MTMNMNTQEFLARSGVRLEILECWIEQHWVMPETTSDEMRFSECDMARALFIQDLKHDFGVNDEGIDLALHLLDQLHGLRNVLAQLRAQSRGS